MAEGELDNRVRVHVYRRFVEDGRPPTHTETAAALQIGEDEAEASYRRLEAGRVLVLAPGTSNVWMANPLSAVPTPFRVETPRGSYYGNCIWDAFGVVAMLGRDGRVETQCQDCFEPLAFTVTGGRLAAAEAVVHYAVPAAHWWDNIGFT